MNMNELKAHMARKGHKQASLAKEIGISTTSLSNKMNGRAPWTLDNVLKIIKVLDIDNYQEIFFGSTVSSAQRKDVHNDD